MKKYIHLVAPALLGQYAEICYQMSQAISAQNPAFIAFLDARRASLHDAILDQLGKSRDDDEASLWLAEMVDEMIEMICIK